MFKDEFTKIIKKEIAKLKKDGIISMGADNLWQLTASSASYLPSAPKGTNASYVAREIFDEIVKTISFVY